MVYVVGSDRVLKMLADSLFSTETSPLDKWRVGGEGGTGEGKRDKDGEGREIKLKINNLTFNLVTLMSFECRFCKTTTALVHFIVKCHQL